jgi:prolyl oligopeptidase
MIIPEKLIREIKLPGVGTAGGFSGKKKEKNLYFSFTNYITPGSIFSLDTQTGTSVV